MSKEGKGSVLVIDGDILLGILTERDVVRKVVATGAVANATNVTTVMSNDLVTVSPGEDLYTAILKMNQNSVKHLPVVDDKLVGIVSVKDILFVEPALIEKLRFNQHG